LAGSSNTPPLVAPFSVLPDGWEEHGCISEGAPYVNTMNGDHIEQDDMSPLVCVNHCNQKGFSLAGLDGDKGCFCANSLENGGTMNRLNDQCTFTCSGSRYELCGGARHLRVYTKTPGATSSDSTYPYPPAGARLTQVYTSNGSTTPIPNSQTPGSNSGQSSPGNPGSAGPEEHEPSPPTCRPRRRAKRSRNTRTVKVTKRLASALPEPIPIPVPVAVPSGASHLARHHRRHHSH